MIWVEREREREIETGGVKRVKIKVKNEKKCFSTTMRILHTLVFDLRVDWLVERDCLPLTTYLLKLPHKFLMISSRR